MAPQYPSRCPVCGGTKMAGAVCPACGRPFSLVLLALLIPAVMLVGCPPKPAPIPPAPSTSDAAPPPAPSPTVTPPAPVRDAAPPPAPSDVCAVQCAHLHDIKCPDWSDDCEVNCRRLDANLAKIHSKPVDHACLTAAATCTAAQHCGQ